MGTVQAHYEDLLAGVYSWMFGGFDQACANNATFFEQMGIVYPGSGVALDLGAGCGFQSIPLARLGFPVVAIDTDEMLLAELRAHAGGLSITPVHDDLMQFERHCASGIALAVCMTDTLLHLESPETVRTLCAKVHGALEPGGKFIVSFRDLSHELCGLDRFIPVRSDASRIMTCFLEYAPEKVLVHDLVHERNGDAWDFRKSCYAKLRLAKATVIEYLSDAGFGEIQEHESRGMITLIAEKQRPA